MHLSLSFALAACTLTLALSTPNQQSTPVSMNSPTQPWQRTTQVQGTSGYQCITISQLNLCPVIRCTKPHFFLFVSFTYICPKIPPNKQTNIWRHYWRIMVLLWTHATETLLVLVLFVWIWFVWYLFLFCFISWFCFVLLLPLFL